MYYTRCMHPPGGATPLSAVIGVPNIHALGYQYIITSIAINTVIILLSTLFLTPCFIGGAILHLYYQKNSERTTIKL
ncbi:MAG: hypothetical protein HN550_03255 [Deltaproteobacteria bacterium]|nr:hypothetical protein [Deltaproteobacteria bacterium]MBT5485746.1 hypothetical protein [Deltaproteobacteria bacterium]MBT7810324.1 hypothetical protein [Deltaproteobacteria bacterium]